MVRVGLPREVELQCPECRAKFKTSSRSLSNRAKLFCPFCETEFDIYNAMSGLLRRQIYHAIRDAMEQRIYEQKHIEAPGYFEDAANLE